MGTISAGTNGAGIGTSTFAMYEAAVAELELPDVEREQVESFLDTLYTQIEENVGNYVNCEGKYHRLNRPKCHCHPSNQQIFEMPSNLSLLGGGGGCKPPFFPIP